ncbi:MAG: MFS transporter [Acidimicrobiales bacterium]|nr:MFS transporter [Acidimicrobiia bacterium]NNF53613.1 MFS transporter [Acidimicrobiales bacterium]
MDRSEQTTTARKALAVIAVSQLFAMSLWFSATAVTPQLQSEWLLSEGEIAWLTLSVQIGFVVGAFSSAVLNIADIIPSRRLFGISAVIGLTANLGLLAVTDQTVGIAMLLRFVTGVALAGLYPSGLKVAAGWYERGRGMALGVLVGALTIGSASPNLIRGLGLEWRGVIVTASLLAGLSAVIMVRWVSDGPFESTAEPFSFKQVGRVLRNEGFRWSTLGYLGHMWELYAMWTWTAAFLIASSETARMSYGSIPTVTFLVIASGGAGAWLAGMWADRIGRSIVAGTSLAISGSVALLSPWLFGRTPWIVIPAFLVWGFAVVADSAQFSAMVAETAEPPVRGTSLALQTATGFLLTLVTIRGVPLLAAAWGWRWSFILLAVGPAVGIVAMARIRTSPARALIAGGRG